jgi:ferredoxin
MVAERMHAYLSNDCDADIFSIEKSAINLNNYDAFVIGTPVYNGAPARVVTEFFDRIDPLAQETPAFVYNTRGFGSFNTNRILAKQMQTKNIFTIMDKSYRSPASDGALIAPFIQRFFAFEKNLQRKVAYDCIAFLKELEKAEKAKKARGYIPRFRLTSILNAPNKMAGQMQIFKIHLHRDKCTKCGVCIKNCPLSVLEKDGESGYPTMMETVECQKCYRCIHHCPSMALSLSKKKTPKRLLDFGK